MTRRRPQHLRHQPHAVHRGRRRSTRPGCAPTCRRLGAVGHRRLPRGQRQRRGVHADPRRASAGVPGRRRRARWPGAGAGDGGGAAHRRGSRAELAEDAVAAGLDATQVYSLDLGHGYVPTADEQRTYLRTVLDHAPGDLVAVDAPVGRIPLRAGAARRAARRAIPRVVGVNVTHPRPRLRGGGPRRGRRACRRARRRPPARARRPALGATGIPVSEGNLAPRLCVALIERIDAGDRDGAAPRPPADHGRCTEATQALGGHRRRQGRAPAARRARRLAAAAPPPGRRRPGAVAGRRAGRASVWTGARVSVMMDP